MKYGIIALVLGILIAAGAFVLWKMDQGNKQAALNPSQYKTDQVNPPPATTGKQQPAPAPVTQADTSVVAKLIAMNPPTGASQEQMKDFSSQVSKASVKTDTLDISSCSPNPAVIQVKSGSSFTIKNSDSVSHKLFHGSIFSNLEVPARGQRVVNTADFPGPGVYIYSCDTRQVGIVFVLQS